MNNIDDNIDDNLSSSSNDEPKCTICFETLNGDIKQLECSHTFHEKCISEWFKSQSTCPICRKEIEGVKRINNNITNTLVNDNYLQETLLGYTSIAGNTSFTSYNNNDTLSNCRRIIASIIPVFCILLIIIVIAIGVKSSNECFLVDCAGLDKKSCNQCSLVTFENKNGNIKILNETCYWAEVVNSSDISVDCVKYNNTSLCFNLNDCMKDCSKCCTKNLCLINKCIWNYEKWYNGYICH